MEHYHILELIGEGSFGKVYRGRRKFSGQIVALKFVSKHGRSVKEIQNIRDEMSILRRLDHENIIAILDFFETDGEFCMITEYAQGDLFQILEDDKCLPENVIRNIAIQLLQALKILHSHKIIHRDMKPQNVLIGAHERIKLCDFGFARTLQHGQSVLNSIKGTPLYMAPELVQERPYNHTLDLWSLGIILYELAVGRPPFYTNRIVSLIQMIIRDPVKYPKGMSDELQSFLKGLLNKNPKRRLTWPEIEHHPFVRESEKDRMQRELIKSQMRTLPRFFSEELRTDSVQLKGHGACQSAERLKSCGKWTVCDPRTGKKLEAAKDRIQPEHGNQSAHIPVLPVKPAKESVISNQALADKIIQAQNSGVEETENQKKEDESQTPKVSRNFLKIWEAQQIVILHEKHPPSNVSEILAYFKKLRVLDLIEGCKRLTVSGGQGEYQTALKRMNDFAKFLHHYLLVGSHDIESQIATADRVLQEGQILEIARIALRLSKWSHAIVERVSDVPINSHVIEYYEHCYNALRCCVIMSTLCKFVFRKEKSRDMKNDLMLDIYRDVCFQYLSLVVRIVQLDAPAMFSIQAKALRWLGAMLDYFQNVPIFLGELAKSAVTNVLCRSFLASNIQDVNGTSAKKVRYAQTIIFLMSEISQLGKYQLGPRLQYPIMILSTRNSIKVREHAVSKCEFDTQFNTSSCERQQQNAICNALAQGLLKSKIDRLLYAMFVSSSRQQCRKYLKDSDDGVKNCGEGIELQDKLHSTEEESLTTSILQLLLCCVSHFGNKSAHTFSADSHELELSPPDAAFTSTLITGIQDSVLTMRETVLAIELLSSFVDHDFLKTAELCQCSAVLYRKLCKAKDRVLVSSLCCFFADLIKSDDKVAAFSSMSSYSKVYDSGVQGMVCAGELPDDILQNVLYFVLGGFSKHHKAASNISLTALNVQNLPIWANNLSKGLLDSGFEFLQQLLTKALHPTSECDAEQNHLRLLAYLTVKWVWKAFGELLDHGGQGCLSPNGVCQCLCLIKNILTAVLETSDHSIESSKNTVFASGHVIQQMLPPIIQLLDAKHIECLEQWQFHLGHSQTNVTDLLSAVIQILQILLEAAQFSSGGRKTAVSRSFTMDSLIKLQEILYDEEAVKNVLRSLRLCLTRKLFKTSNTSCISLIFSNAMSFLSRLITTSHHFGDQFIREDGLTLIEICGALKVVDGIGSEDYDREWLNFVRDMQSSGTTIQDTLTIVIQLARPSAEHYALLSEQKILTDLGNLVALSTNALLKAKALNAIGNFCRHSSFFYTQLIECKAEINGSSLAILNLMIQALDDEDACVRQFACLAIGNAAFHDALLYQNLSCAIPALIRNAQEPQPKTRSNASGALGNLVRNSDTLCLEMCNLRVAQSLWEFAKIERDTNTRQIMLFAIGNLCVYPICNQQLLSPQSSFRKEISDMNTRRSILSDDVSARNIARILENLEIYHTKSGSKGPCLAQMVE